MSHFIIQLEAYLTHAMKLIQLEWDNVFEQETNAESWRY